MNTLFDNQYKYTLYYYQKEHLSFQIHMQFLTTLFAHVEFQIFCVLVIAVVIEILLWKCRKLHEESYIPENDYSGDEGSLTCLYWIATVFVPFGAWFICWGIWAHAPMWGKY